MAEKKAPKVKSVKAGPAGIRKWLRHAAHSLAHLLATGAGFAMLGIVLLVVVLGSLPGRHMLVRGFLMPVLSANGVVLDYKHLDTPDVRHWNLDDLTVTIPAAHLSVGVKQAKISLDYHAVLLGRLGISGVSLTGISTARVPAALTAKTSFTASGLVDVFGHGTDLKAAARDVPLDFIAVLGGFSLPEGLAATLNGDVAVLDETVHVDTLTLALRNTATQAVINGKTRSPDLGTVRLDGAYGPDGFDLHVQADKVSAVLAQMAGLGLSSGTMGADVFLKGTVEQPLLSGTFFYEESHRRKRPAVRVAGKLATQDNTVTLDSTFSETGGRNGGTVHLAVPLGKYLAYFMEGKGKIPLAAAITAKLDLSFLRFILDPFEHKLTGTLLLDMTASGDAENPALNGSLRIQKGYYDNIVSGTTLSDIDVSLLAKGQRVTIEKAAAGDGASGRLALLGDVDLSDKSLSRTPINLTFKADHAQLLRRRDMSGSATGSLTLAGTLKGMTLSGKLAVSPFNMSLDSLTAASIPEIEVTDMTPGAETAAPQGGDILSALPPVKMDVTVVVANQAFLRGMGVDAEVGGHVAVGGTLAQSDYSGSFKTIRGSYEILGKKFVLQQGQVDFEGDAMLLNIVGVHHESGIDTTATLSGSLKKLSVALSSVPAMPQDEILSNLLFGKSASSITPFQAVRLAAAIQQMRGGGSGILDPVGTVRETLGLDNLSVGSETTADGQQGMTVGAGKYISDKVYLEVQKTPDPTRPFEADVQIELTPHLNLKSGAGGGGAGGAGNIGLQWKKDY
jgi:translocation and assembly module TamB